MQQRMVPDEYVVMTIEIPDPVSVRKGTFVDARSAEGMLPVWVIPSVIIPQEHNVILYPEAQHFDARILDVEPFRFDARLYAA